jgi:hypothetical protein
MAAFSRTMNTTRVSRLSPPYTHTDAGVGGVRRVQVCVCGCVSERARAWHTLADLTIYIQHAQQQRFETRLVNINIIDVSSICMPQVWIHPCKRVSRWNGDIHQCRAAQNISRQHHYHGKTAKSIKAKQNSNVFILGQLWSSTCHSTNNSTFEGRNVEWRSSYNSPNESMEIANSFRSSFCKA